MLDEPHYEGEERDGVRHGQGSYEVIWVPEYTTVGAIHLHEYE